MPKRWLIAPFDSERVADLQRAAGVSSVVAQLLIARGIDDVDEVRRFLDAKLTGLREPDRLPHVPQAAQLLHEAIRAEKRITIYGDYDADGMTATAILFRCLRLLGTEVDFYVPHRIDEGYGLNSDALARLARQGSQVVVTVDCGIASLSEARVAAELGLLLIVTDHHQMVDRLPEAAAIVHPQLPNDPYPFAGLCGAAVAFKLAWALCQRVCQSSRVREPHRAFLLQAVGLAAIGTVADVVPLLDENRILVRHGLGCLKAQPLAGLSALMRLTGLDKKERLEGDDIGFTLAPRLNAAGRMGQAQIGIELLTTDNLERAGQLAQFVDDLNEQRKSIERSIQLSVTKKISTLSGQGKLDLAGAAALVLADHDWHPGVIGIVAGRLAEKYHRPVVLIALDPLGTGPGTGSARSVPGFNLHQAFSKCSQHLESYGGHAAAAGLRIRPENLDPFRKTFVAVAEERISDEMRVAELRVDAEAPLHTLTYQTVQQIESLAPFGQGNRRPVLCTSNVRLAGEPRRIGSGGRHLAMTFDQHGVKIRGVAFGGGDWKEEITGAKGRLSIAFRPVINHFRGRHSVEVHLADWRVEEE